MPAKKIKGVKKHTAKSVSKTVVHHRNNDISLWKKLLISLGLSLILIVPLLAVAQGTQRAVLGVATKIKMANTPVATPTTVQADPNVNIIK